MQIILEENEIMDALNAYCAKQIILPEGKRIKVDFTVGRGNNGNTRATIEFEDVNTTVSVIKNETPTATPEKKVKKVESEKQVYDDTEEVPKKNPEPSVSPITTQQEKKESSNSPEVPSVKTDSLFNF